MAALILTGWGVVIGFLAWSLIRSVRRDRARNQGQSVPNLRERLWKLDGPVAMGFAVAAVALLLWASSTFLVV